MRFSEASGRNVVSTSSATTVGRVHGFVVDPLARRVVALELKKTDGEGDTLTWDAMTAFGRDAVTVPGTEAITTAEGRVQELTGKAHAMLGKRVLTESGDEVGKLEDVEFEAVSGKVTALLTKSEEIAGDRLIGVGSYAVVVRSAPAGT